MVLPKLKSATAAVSLLLTTFMATGCHTQPQHPDQNNVFDGAAYDTMMLTHSALTSLRASITTEFPQYIPEFNKVVDAYNASFVIYSAYHDNSQAELSVSAALGNLTVSLTGLETALIADLHIDQQHSASVRKAAQKIRERASANLTIADVLTELEIAASLASGVPATAAYSALANAIINATGTAIIMEQANASKPIRLDAIAALTPIL